MFRKKLVPLFIAGCMLTSSLPSMVYAAAESDISTASADIPVTEAAVAVDKTSQEPAADDLERIITVIKSKITIPEELTQFDYNFSTDNYYGSAIWNLNWYAKEGNRRISASCDQSGNILSFSSYDGNSNNYVPKFYKSELKNAASEFIKKVTPDIAGKIEYVGVTADGTYSGQYNYQFQRVENGIPMPDNTVTVGVNYQTGNVTSFNSNWLYNVKIPSAETKITKNEAAGKIGKTVTMKLSYQNAYITDKNGDTKIKAFLVYSPDNAYTAVDAKTGEVYTTQNEWVQAMDSAASSEKAAGDMGGNGNLTQEEVTKVDEMKGLITKEAAIKAVTENKSLLLDDTLKSISASLYKQDGFYRGSGESKYIWNINLSDPREVKDAGSDTYRAYAYATVDAATGKLVSFQASVKDYYNMSKQEWESVKVKYTKEQGKSILEDFLKVQIPEKFKNSKLTDNKESYVIAYKDGKEVYGGYYYNYNRVNAEVEYPYNSIYGAVDGVTGKIYSYSYYWDDNVTFESPKNIINKEKAFDAYIGDKGYHLVYEINNIHTIYSSGAKRIIKKDAYSVDNEVRLVYRTDISPNYISPFTGKQLNYDGEEYVDPDKMFDYSDINDNASSRNIRLLAEIGIGFKGGEFQPHKSITGKELTEFLNEAGIYYNNKYKLKNDNSAITRLTAAKFSIQILGYESIAKLKGIYSTNFKDISEISDANLGYAALAQGLNLVTSNKDGEFRPNDKLTRAEAADMLINMLDVEE